jgi:hypothetical protein
MPYFIIRPSPRSLFDVDMCDNSSSARSGQAGNGTAVPRWMPPGFVPINRSPLGGKPMKLELINVGSRQRVVLNKRSVLVGREPDADLRIDDPEVGPYECLIGDASGPGVAIWSLRTDQARTLVNGQPITKANLMPGDRLTVGKTEFEVSYELESRSTMKPPHWLRSVTDEKAPFSPAAWETPPS